MLKKILLIITLCLTVLCCILLNGGVAFAKNDECEYVSSLYRTEADFKDITLAEKARACYLMDYGSETVLYKRNENERYQIASMTKIMLLDLIFDAVEQNKLSYDEEITVSENASSMGGSQVFLQANKNYKAKDLIKSIIVASANDASVAMAERLFATESNCVEEMNKKRAEYEMTNTLFANVTGLPHVSQYSCAKDVATMLSRLIKHKDYFDFSKIYLDYLVHPDGSKTVLTNTNKLVKFYNGCDGGKTGFTNEAGSCLGATAKRDNMRVIAVVMGESDSKTRNGEVAQMFDYAFNNYQSKLIISKNEVLKSGVAVCGGKNTLNVGVAKDFCSFAKKGEAVNFDVEINLNSKLKAPIYVGDKVGSASVFISGVKKAEIDIVAQNNVEKMTVIDKFKDLIQNLKLA